MDLGEYARFALALALVVGLIIALSWGLRRLPGLSHGRIRQGRRLGVIETLTIDPRNKLVLIRRDGAEHLLLLGPESGLVIEQRIDAPGFTPTTGSGSDI